MSRVGLSGARNNHPRTLTCYNHAQWLTRLKTTASTKFN